MFSSKKKNYESGPQESSPRLLKRRNIGGTSKGTLDGFPTVTGVSLTGTKTGFVPNGTKLADGQRMQKCIPPPTGKDVRLPYLTSRQLASYNSSCPQTQGHAFLQLGPKATDDEHLPKVERVRLHRRTQLSPPPVPANTPVPVRSEPSTSVPPAPPNSPEPADHPIRIHPGVPRPAPPKMPVPQRRVRPVRCFN